MGLKGLFGGNKKAEASPAVVGRISAVPGQSDDEREATRAKMQAELDAQRASREARKAAAGMSTEV